MVNRRGATGPVRSSGFLLDCRHLRKPFAEYKMLKTGAAFVFSLTLGLAAPAMGCDEARIAVLEYREGTDKSGLPRKLAGGAEVGVLVPGARPT